MILSREQVKDITDPILRNRRADELMVTVNGSRSGHARFAVNRMTQHQDHSDVTITVKASFGSRSGTATTNRRDRAALAEVVRLAEAAARLAPENPEHMPALGPQKHEDQARAWDQSSASVAPAAKARRVGDVCHAAEREGLLAGGIFTHSASFRAIASSAGLFGYHRSTSSDFSVTARTEDGSGSAKAKQGDVCRNNDLVPLDIARPAFRRALASQQPRRLDPGKYTVIMAPMAWDALVRYLMGAMSARSVDEKRSALYDRARNCSLLGEKVFGENITIRTNLDHPELVPDAFDSDGLPRESVTWIEKGVLKHLFHSRYWAREKKQKPLAWPSHVVMDGGAGSQDDLIKATRRGVLVSNIWYVRMVDPKTLTVTGLTRDGTFLIEDGQIVAPVNNFRFNDSPLRMLKNVTKLAKAVKAGDRIWPAMQVEDFNFHSISEAV